MITNNRSDNLAMNLQLFAGLDDEAIQSQLMAMFSGEAGQQPTVQQQPTEQSTEQPIQPPVENPEGAAPTEPPAEPPVEGQTDNTASGQSQGDPQSEDPVSVLRNQGLDKFKSVEDFAKSYKEMEQYAGRTRSEIQDLKGQLQAINEKLQNQQTQVQDPAQQTSQEPEVDILNDSEALSEMLYSDPAKVIQMLKDNVKAEMQAQVQPILDERADNQRRQDWTRKVDEFSAQHPDTAQWAEPMSRIIMANPTLRDNPNGLEIAYQAAKGQQYQAPADPASYLQNEEFVKNNVLSNPKIKEQIIQQYLAELQNGGTPVTIGQSPVSGSTTLTPPKRPTTLEEASQMAQSWFDKQGQ